MLGSLILWCRGLSGARKATILIALSVALISALAAFKLCVFDVRAENLSRSSGCENPDIETWFIYGPDRFYGLVHNQWSPEDRLYYVRIEYYDYAFIAVYGILFLAVITFSLCVLGSGTKVIVLSAMLPLVTVLTDFAEDKYLIRLIDQNDPNNRFDVFIACFFTSVKSIAVLSMSIYTTCLVGYALKHLWKQRLV
jgi:hypothetical protein